MISRRIVALGTLFTLLLVILCMAASAPLQTNVSARNFEFTYLMTIPASPPGAKTLRLWIPLPQSDPYQAIGGLKIESPFPYAKHRDPEYGNEYLYLQVPAAQVSSREEVRMSFQVTRREHLVELDAHPVSAPSAGVDSSGLQRFLQPDRRVPLSRESSRNSLRRRRVGFKPRWRKPEQSTTTSSPRCATTSPAPVGATAMRSGPAPPSVASALISTRCLSA